MCAFVWKLKILFWKFVFMKKSSGSELIVYGVALVNLEDFLHLWGIGPIELMFKI